MKERPILFNAPMVRALLDGSKTQTRRIVKRFDQVQEITDGNDGDWIAYWDAPTNYGGEVQMNDHMERFRCPYGQPGDRLWVRETGWERPSRTTSMMRDGADTWPSYEYDADGINSDEVESLKMWEWKRRPSIHMPRWASRINLEITGVRVERLQDISEEDAIVEGAFFTDFGKNRYGRQCDGWRCDRVPTGPDDALGSARFAYANLWNSINGAGSWDANPWVWVVEFKSGMDAA